MDPQNRLYITYSSLKYDRLQNYQKASSLLPATDREHGGLHVFPEYATAERVENHMVIEAAKVVCGIRLGWNQGVLQLWSEQLRMS